MNEETIFSQAAGMPPAERSAYLNRACDGDSRLRARIEALLAAHDNPDEFLNAPEVAATEDSPLTERPGTTIGPYKLMEQIGEGGMGIVFVAEQQRPIRRKVALKVIKPGMDSKSIIARFQAERQALAVMDHPNIAKVLDAGTTDAGHPFFVMELVRGIEITSYCDQHKLTIRKRLELFKCVCHAIQHAHQKGIIHRDIKPSNVLVTEQDGQAIAKVIDFGVAKAIGQSLSDGTVYTGFFTVIGTPLYMSPEQAALSNVDVDTRSDVYSLGVLLYELLTGTTPFDKETMKNAAQDEVLRVIREQEPAKPSTKISTLGDRAQRVSQSRSTDVVGLGRTVRGDLDWIVMKAIDKDRNRRYDSPNRLAADIGCFLKNAAIEARPPSTWYQLRKAYQRNKTLALMSVTVFVAMTIGLGGALWGLMQARDRSAVLRDERDRYQRLLNEYQPLVMNDIYDKVFSGNIDAATKALRNAKDVGVKDNELAVLRGIQQIFSGEQESYREGIRTFEQRLALNADDPIALSMLVWAHATGYGDSRILADISQRHRNLAPPDSDREKAIWAVGLSTASHFRGPAHDFAGAGHAKDMLVGIVARNPSWRLPRLLLARVLSDYSVDSGQECHVVEAIDTHLPQILNANADFRESPFCLAQQLHVYSVGARMLSGERRARCRQEADRLAELLLTLGHDSYSLGRLERALYFTNIAELDGATDFSRAIAEWSLFKRDNKSDLFATNVSGLLVRASMISGDWRQAEEYYAVTSGDGAAFMRGNRKETLARCASLPPDSTIFWQFWTYADMYACGHEARQEAMTYFTNLKASGDYPPWIVLPLGLYLGDLSPEEVIESGSESKIHTSMTNFVVGHYLAASGQDADAAIYLDRAIRADAFMVDSHQWAHALRLRIEKDPTWYQRMNPSTVAK